MRRFSLTLLATAAIGLVATVASAADLPRKAPAYQPPPPPPVYNWSGFYVGGFLGGGWVRNDVTDTSFVINGVENFGQLGKVLPVAASAHSAASRSAGTGRRPARTSSGASRAIGPSRT